VLPPSKSHQIRTAWNGGDRIKALRIAAKFFDRSEVTKCFKRGMDAHNNPTFYSQLGHDPRRLVDQALEALAERFGLEDCPSSSSEQRPLPDEP